VARLPDKTPPCCRRSTVNVLKALQLDQPMDEGGVSPELRKWQGR
jgi:hypothetical protein